MNNNSITKQELKQELIDAFVMNNAINNSALRQMIKEDTQSVIDNLSLSIKKDFNDMDDRFSQIENRLEKIESKVGIKFSPAF